MIKRRSFFTVITAGLAAVGIERWTTKPVAAGRLVAILGDLPAARELGRCAAPSVPHGNDLNAVAATLLRRHPPVAAALSGQSDRVLAATLRDAVDTDLRAGRTRLADGWVLAETEVDLCILAHLT